ncbi:MAG: CoA transferase [Rhizobiales bacterium]|nr:CoA transferase [Hyphomicrobiales bacterium]
MKTTFEIISGLWSLAGGAPEDLSHLDLAGVDPVLPSSFWIGSAAQASIAAAGLAAATAWRMKTGKTQRVHVDMHHAAAEFRSERYLQIDAQAPGSLWDPIAGLYQSGDGHVRLHTNFPHHRDHILDLLKCATTRDAVQAALLTWQSEAFETAANEAGCVVSAYRSHAQWMDHAQSAAIAAQPVIRFTKIGEACPRPLPEGPRPLSHWRVLDLTRIVAGPVGGRTLAAHGADVLRITSPHLPDIDWLIRDNGRGKLTAHADLDTEDGREALRELMRDTDIFMQGYRPGGMTRRGFSPEQVAKLRPGIIYVSLSAYGSVGPWAMRRGFDSLVQTATGFNHAEGLAAGTHLPKELPAQALDHASGHLMAFSAMMARLRQAAEGGSWHVEVSLAQTGRWLWDMGRVENGFAAMDPKREDITDFLETLPSGFGTLSAVSHAAKLSETPCFYARPSMPSGSHDLRWPGA